VEKFNFFLNFLGSYRLSKRPNNGVNDSDQQNSSRSDIYSSSSSTVAAGNNYVDPRVYQTTFTTKRIGNVIVKKVTLPESTSGFFLIKFQIFF